MNIWKKLNTIFMKCKNFRYVKIFGASNVALWRKGLIDNMIAKFLIYYQDVIPALLPVSKEKSYMAFWIIEEWCINESQIPRTVLMSI